MIVPSLRGHRSKNQFDEILKILREQWSQDGAKSFCPDMISQHELGNPSFSLLTLSFRIQGFKLEELAGVLKEKELARIE